MKEIIALIYVPLSMMNGLCEVVGKLVHPSNNEDHFSLGIPSSSDVELLSASQLCRNFI